MHTTMPELMWQEYAGSSWRIKELAHLNPVEHLGEIMFYSIQPPGFTSDCPGSQYSPGPDLGGDFPGQIHGPYKLPSTCCVNFSHVDLQGFFEFSSL